MALLFFCSGAAALIYEVVWFQQLQLVLGSTSVSLAVLLGTFMGGMGAGSLLGPRWLSRRISPMHGYALLELGVAVCAAAFLLARPFLARFYLEGLSHGLPARAVVAAALLFPACFLMGATLPVAARALTPRGLALAYAANLVGAMAGCLGSAFYLLRYHDAQVTTWVAQALNVLVFVLALLWGRGPQNPQEDSPGPLRWRPMLSLALSGCCSMACQVVWIRLLTLIQGNTIYCFSLVLSVFLAGLGLGSALAARFRSGLAHSQLFAALGIAWAGLLITTPGQWSLPRVLLALLPATMAWGASFPLALREAGQARVGSLYAANTFGAIAGAVGASLGLIPWLGSQGTEQLMLALSVLSALVAAAPPRVLVFLVLVVLMPPIPDELLVYGRYGARPHEEVLYAAEGRNETVGVTLDRTKENEHVFYVSGRPEASSHVRDMALQEMLATIPARLRPPRDVLVVGCGSGVTAGTFLSLPGVRSVTVVELEPLIPRFVVPFFARQNHDLLSDPRVDFVFDDARHFMLTSDRRFDLITSDPIHPWMRGSAALYTEEYFQSMRAHLNPGGVVSQWVPLYESYPDTVRCVLATFFRVFPQGTVWANGEDYDLTLLSEPAPFPGAFCTAQDLEWWLTDAPINTDDNLRLQYLAAEGARVDRASAIYRDMMHSRDVRRAHP